MWDLVVQVLLKEENQCLGRWKIWKCLGFSDLYQSIMKNMSLLWSSHFVKPRKSLYLFYLFLFLSCLCLCLCTTKRFASISSLKEIDEFELALWENQWEIALWLLITCAFRYYFGFVLVSKTFSIQLDCDDSLWFGLSRLCMWNFVSIYSLSLFWGQGWVL